MNGEQSGELLQFLRQHRSNEANFDKIYQKLEEEISTAPEQSFVQSLKEIKEKHAEEYLQAKTNGGSAWPEFEKFVSEIETAIIEINRDQK